MSESRILGLDGRPLIHLTSAGQNKRNYAFSSAGFAQLPQAEFAEWSVSRSVREGYSASVWVYRAITIIRNAITQAPFIVVDAATRAPLTKHPLQMVLDRPNAKISRMRTFSLLASWLQLSGVAYLIRTSAEGGKLQLWPCAPDRIGPIVSRENTIESGLVTGYGARDGRTGESKILFRPDEIIPIMLDDPANPSQGISPLQAAAKVVDADIAQIQWNYSAMRNRGVVDGFISFEDEIDQDQVDAIQSKVQERYGGSDNARKIGVFGSSAKYTRIGLNSAEMDFIESRKQGRDEQLAAFGVPSQLANANESSTYNNFKIAEVILWNNTMIPLLNIIADALTFALQMAVDRTAPLRDDEIIIADLSRVAALQESSAGKAEAVRAFAAAGIPMSQINRILNLGLQEFDGWDKPQAAPAFSPSPVRESRFRLLSIRAISAEAQRREVLAEAIARRLYIPLLRSQHDQLNAAIEQGVAGAVDKLLVILAESRGDWVDALTANYTTVGADIGATVVVETRAMKDFLKSAITLALDAEDIILQEISAIEAATISRVRAQIDDAIENGKSIGDLQQALEDVGAFTPERALRIARTVTGAAGNLGQVIAATEGGATTKRWETSGFGVRAQHEERDGEVAAIAEPFTGTASANGVYPMYPLDPRLAPGDRINCRCVVTFS